MARRNTRRRQKGGANSIFNEFNTHTISKPSPYNTNNNTTRKSLHDRLLYFEKKLRNSGVSGATGATGPEYDRDLLIDQIFVIDEAIQPFRTLVRETDDLMHMVQKGTASFVKEKHANTASLVDSRIRRKTKSALKKLSKISRRSKVPVKDMKSLLKGM